MEPTSFAVLMALALGLALQPWSVLAAVLLAAAKGGIVKAGAFLTGWMSALTAVGVAAALLLPARAATPSASTSYAGVELALGALLAAILIWRWRRGPAASPETPGWVDRLDTMSPIVALALGAFLPNYILVAAAVDQLLQVGWTGAGLAVAIALFVVVASLGVAAPLAVPLVKPDQASAIHQRWREWLLANCRPVEYALGGSFVTLLVVKGILGIFLA